jgi:hypothetical protein
VSEESLFPFYFAHYIIKAVLCARNNNISSEVLNIFDREVENCLNVNYVKVKQSLYRRLVQAKRVPGGRGSQISRQSAHEGLTHRPPLPHQEIFLVQISVRG